MCRCVDLAGGGCRADVSLTLRGVLAGLRTWYRPRPGSPHWVQEGCAGWGGGGKGECR